MSDLITGLRQVIQDLVAPDLKAILSRQESLQKQIEVQHDAVVKTIEAFRAEMRSEFAALRANNQLEVLRQVSPLSERLAVVEKKA
ncbi:MAG TPA: hypothetical protein VIH91_03740 [Terriglobales bacterium]|jgi:hypothetical protein